VGEGIGIEHPLAVLACRINQRQAKGQRLLGGTRNSTGC
jgi:hypothetical protein